MSCWIRLGIEPTNDPDVIRGAYRALLPQHHPETDPQGFQALREAYEHALRLARDEQDEIPEFPEHDEPRPARNALIEQTMSDFAKLLADPRLRFDPPAWQAFIDGFSTLTLGDQEQISWHLMYKLMETGPLSHACAQLMARHLGWENEVLRLEDPRQADEFLERISEPDPFDTRVMKHWSAEAQVEALWFARNLDYLYHTRPLFEFESFVTLHTCVPLPDDQAYIHSLLVKLCQAGIGSPTFFTMVAEQQRQAPDDIDLLYMLACQASDTDQEELARQCWTRLWREHQHPEAGRWLLNLCAQHQPQRLPLLIQALDRLEPVHAWPQDLSDPAQIWGSPSQRPETLTRWFEAARDEYPGIAGEFIKWRLDGKDELPLLAWLLDDQPDRQLHRLYRHAWALHRGDSGLLRQILDEPLGDDPLDLLIIEGFKYQAEQQLRWLEQSPLALALTAFINSPSAQPQLPEVLCDGSGLAVARDWLRRVRSYPAATLPKLTARIKPANLMPTPFAVQLLSDLAEAGIELPRPPADDGLWTWHRQNLYMLALVEQPERWLAMAPVQLLASLPYPAEHPFSGLQQLLLQLRQQQGNADGLLGWLDDNDPLQAFIGERLLTVQQALDSSKLPSNLKLYACLENDPRAFDDDVLGLMVLCGVLYHDPSLSAEQHGSLLRRISTMTCPEAWFEPFRSGLIKGEPVRPPRKVLEEDELINSTLFYSMLDTLKDLARYGSAGVPRAKVLKELQRGKDYPGMDTGIRAALTALLSWSERLLLANAGSQPVPASHVWKLGSRLGRKGYAVQVVGSVILGPILTLMSGSMVEQIFFGLLFVGLLGSATLRRLHDIGRGIPMMIIFVMLIPFLHFLPLVLLLLPGEPLPNRYGVPPVNQPQDNLQGGLQAALRRLNGQ
ncbi:DUF805 domain-containing protein [Pseudomonas rubra]|uniref:DUF805 domain-containing protein n=1 Tax=Pseudomonas rubra TaxID=2942627 RepID=A0ABT5P5K6_9PSED|nr:DUF805 domain-containing protein [Pseudomonas rubra]MDD1013571.1 DUF805 domain-containing protein [Pseudomonas rubra]MDD1040111.1 DUF805 domain-containing protein [Pseudomonas rubra]MDD1155883.1 DUF805 domain-containing protein [Pseudomonas rubra]